VVAHVQKEAAAAAAAAAAQPSPEHDAQVMEKWTVIMAAALAERLAKEAKDKEDQEALCFVCGAGDAIHGDQIVFCERCDIAVHQHCYGVPTIPTHDYFCYPCAAHIAAGGKEDTVYTKTRKGLHQLQCVLCSERAPRGGAFTSTDLGPNAWVHIVCARWLGIQHSSITMDDETYTAQCAEFLQEGRAPAGVCLFCRQNEGGLLRCMTTGCQAQFHVTCARESERCVMDSLTHRKEPARWRALCPAHVSSKDTERMRRSLQLSLAKNEVEDDQESSVVAAAAAAAAAVSSGRGAAAAASGRGTAAAAASASGGSSGSSAAAQREAAKARSKAKEAATKRANNQKKWEAAQAKANGGIYNSGDGGGSSSSSAPVSRKH
jgi:PHD-zinc-finger like domain/PHD-finger